MDVEAEEIGQQTGPLRGQKTLGMKLNTIHGLFGPLRSQAHDRAILQPRADFKSSGVDGVAVHDQRVISRRLERLREAFEDASPIMMDG